MKVLGVEVPSPVIQAIKMEKDFNDQTIQTSIQDAVKNPTKSIKELQNPSPIGQFIDFTK